ncbi:MAG: aspartate aminotransferase family protein [Planctomycetota bacterium]
MSTIDSLSSQETMHIFQEHVIGNYTRYPVNLVRGEGSRVWDSEGQEYLDFFPGWGCNLLGHCPPRVVEAVKTQVERLIHVPNTWHMSAQGLWAKMLGERSFGAQSFFCNSGAEANEAAIKLARLHQGPERYRIITFQGGFHGRTFGALAATAQPKYHEGLGPMLAGFTYVAPGNLEEVERKIDETTAAIMIEPIQGEGGVNIHDEGFLKGLRELADENNLLLIFDEVQTGCGRTGEWFGYQYFGVEPDILTLAKSLCGGLAGGAMLAKPDVAKSLVPGMHASTFGGNPIAAVAGIAMLETIEADDLLSQTAETAKLFSQCIEDLQDRCEGVREVRQAGLMIGIEIDCDGGPIVQRCMENGLLINCTQGNVLRLLPAMNISPEEVRQGMEILSDAVAGHLAGEAKTDDAESEDLLEQVDS